MAEYAGPVALITLPQSDQVILPGGKACLVTRLLAEDANPDGQFLTLTIEDLSVSRRQGLISIDQEGRALVMNLSQNGTRLDGIAMPDRSEMKWLPFRPEDSSLLVGTRRQYFLWFRRRAAGEWDLVVERHDQVLRKAIKEAAGAATIEKDPSPALYRCRAELALFTVEHREMVLAFESVIREALGLPPLDDDV